MGEYKRRKKGWELERDTADFDLQEIDKQIEMTRLRHDIAAREIEIHKKTIEHNEQIEYFYRSKFSNQALYNWMVGRLSALYFQAYKLAYDMAKSAEKAVQYELPTNDTYISFGHWDSLKKGLLAGESMMLELNRMEKAHLDQDSRFLEIEKTISLRQLDPKALIDLITQGACEFWLSEALFDLDYPGHYCRMIKSISISVKAELGPYQSVQATLVQLGNKTLLEPDINAVHYLMGMEGAEQPDASVLRTNWRANQQIAVSQALEDDGMFGQFDLNFLFDDRYFPFEGTGAVSYWRLEMPKATNPFDFGTIEDVIIHLKYTSKSDSGAFREAVKETISTRGGYRFFNLANDFPEAWRAFVTGEREEFEFQPPPNVFPPNLKDIKIRNASLMFEVKEGASPRTQMTFTLRTGTRGGSATEFHLKGPGEVETQPPGTDGTIRYNLSEPWTLTPENRDGIAELSSILLMIAYEGELDWGNNP